MTSIIIVIKGLREKRIEIWVPEKVQTTCMFNLT